MDNYSSVVGMQNGEEASEQESFQCSLFLQDARTILLCDATPSFFSLFRMDLQDKGHNVYSKLTDKLKFLTDLLQQGDLNNRNIQYFAELKESNTTSFWDIVVESAPPFLHLMAQRCTAQEVAERYCIAGTVDLASFYVPGYHSILIVQDQAGEYRVQSCNTNARRFYETDSAVEGNILSKFSFLRSTKLFACSANDRSLCFYEMIQGQRAGQRQFVRLLCLPVEQGERKAFLLLGTLCPADEFFDRHATGGYRANNGFESCPYAVALFSFSRETPALESYNSCWSAFLRAGFSLPELLRCQAVLRSFQKGIPCTGKAKISNETYEVSALPILKDGRTQKMMVTVVPCEQEQEEPAQCFTGSLTPREQETLALAAQGLSNRYIAHRLSISEGTVKKLIYNGYQKLGISSRVELCRMLAPQVAAI